MKRGDIVRVQLPQPAGRAGSEQYGFRPAVIVQSDDASSVSSVVLLVPMTSQVAAARFPGAFLVSPTQANGLTVKSVVLTNQLRAIDRCRVEEVIGTLTDDEMAALDTQMRRLLAL